MKKLILCSVLMIPFVSVTQGAMASSLSQEEQLGKIMYQDKDFSYNSMQSCQTCHHRSAGFADPTNARDPYYTVVSLGADGVSKGGRNAPSAAYAGYSKPLYQDTATGEWYGGMFWDGGATGHRLFDALAEQAQGPPLNPVEMNMPSKEAIVQVVRDSSYKSLFLRVNGRGSLNDTEAAYDLIGYNIATYERSVELQQFNSRYDRGELTTSEQRGMTLFAGKCGGCHSMEDTTGKGALFTNYGYKNLGIPVNPLLDAGEIDNGLEQTLIEINQLDIASLERGKFKIPTLRNVGLTAPYGHNGYFPTLASIISFKNTRDTGDWEVPEVTDNMTDEYEMGSLGLTDSQVNDLVQFLMALTDK